MATKQLFGKKATNKSVDAITENAREKDNEVIKKSSSENDDSGKVRLSCDLSKQHHLALRIASVNCEQKIIEMIETLISRHLMNRDIELIISDYHKERGEDGVRVK